jgi:hypothetical protein
MDADIVGIKREVSQQGKHSQGRGVEVLPIGFEFFRI